MNAQDVQMSELLDFVKGKTVKSCVFSETINGDVWLFYFEDGSELEINEWYGAEYTDKDKFLKAPKP